MGHSNVGTTAVIYLHTAEAMEREAAVASAKSIFGNPIRCKYAQKAEWSCL